MNARHRASLAILSMAWMIGCGAAFRPFAMRDVMWRDADDHPFEGPPPERYVPWAWEAADHTVFRQMSRALLYERGREAINVNALDEVPDSSWYTNRLSRWDLSIDALARGACDMQMPPPPYEVTRGKIGGSSPGAIVRAGDGHTYLLKIDFLQPERATAADAIGTRITYAAGYDTPCNWVLDLHPSDIRIADGARSSEGNEPYTEERLHQLLSAATPGPHGTHRVSLSLFVEGALGPFRFEGIAEDDPNDVIPHEMRRELRGFYVLSAWMNHIDARAENNLDRWIETSEGHGYVRHTILDVGDSFGIVWVGDIEDGMARRFGHSYYLDIGQILGDIGTLGALDRPYWNAQRGPAADVFGYYDVERFVPSDWHSGYPNPAFEQRTEADCAWMARIISRFDERALRAIVQTGRFSRTLYENELVRILMGRRERILERYLVRLSPLSFPQIERERLCLRDLAIESGLRMARDRTYDVRRFEGLPPSGVDGATSIEHEASSVCVALPRSSNGVPSYHVIDVFARTVGREQSHPARVHLWEIAPNEWRIAGLERPDSDSPP